MTTNIHPKKSLAAAVAERREETKGQKGVDKRFTMMKGAMPGGTTKAAEGEEFSSGLMRPTDEQLEIINGFTRSPKSAEELVVFNTWSANDIPDRDFDYFTTDTIKEFAALPDPFGPVGKSYMIGHDYKSMPIGRIFATETQQVDGVEWLRNSVYIPDIDANKSFLENQDFGVYWAVSVGVVLDKATCDICDSEMVWYFCEEGHIKGLYYDPKSEETDSWGWPEPVSPDTKGAEQALGKFEGARDFYELSQVWLGAQYFAGLADKNPNLAGVIKAAGVRPIGLGKADTEDVPVPHVPEQVREAQLRFNPKEADDGTLTWKDESDLVWVFNPEENEVMSLGKAETTDQEEDDGEDDPTGSTSDGDGGEPDEESLGDGEGKRPDAGGSADPADGDAGTGAGEPAPEALGVKMPKERVLKAAKRAGIAAETLVLAEEKAADEDSFLDGLLDVLAAKGVEQQKAIDELTPKAELGEAFRKDVISEAIDWYVKANQTNGEPVKTATFEKVLAACGNDIELLKELREEQHDLARKRFPGSVRRSSFETDPNSSKESSTTDPEAEVKDSDSRVRKLHG